MNMPAVPRRQGSARPNHGLALDEDADGAQAADMEPPRAKRLPLVMSKLKGLWALKGRPPADSRPRSKDAFKLRPIVAVYAARAKERLYGVAAARRNEDNAEDTVSLSESEGRPGNDGAFVSPREVAAPGRVTTTSRTNPGEVHSESTEDVYTCWCMPSKAK